MGDFGRLKLAEKTVRNRQREVDRVLKM